MIPSKLRFRAFVFVGAVVLMAGGFCAPTFGQGVWGPDSGISKETLEDIISRGMIYFNIKTAQAGPELSKCYRYSAGGAEALVALAELEAGVVPNEAELAKLIDKVAKQNSGRVFARATRTAMLVKLYQLTSDRKLAPRIQADVDWLVGRQLSSGGWGESTALGNTNDTADVLRVLMSAAQVGAKVRPDVWGKAGRFLRQAQNADGGFGYFSRDAKQLREHGASNGAATAAGAAAWAVLMKVGKLSPEDAKRRQGALAWLDRNYQIEDVPAWQLGAQPLYAYLYDLACATGQPMRLGGRDVDVQIFNLLQARQRRSGAWLGQAPAEDDIVSSAWATLILRKIQPAQTPSGPVTQPTTGVLGQGNQEITKSAKPERFVVIGRIAVPESSIDFDKIAAGLSDALNKAITIGVRYKDIYLNDIKFASVSGDVSMLWLTGERPDDFETLQPRKIINFVNGGGVLLVDSSTGDQRVFESARRKLAAIFGARSLERIPTGDPLLRGNFGVGLGCDITAVQYNPAAADLLKETDGKNGPPLLWAVRRNDKIIVVLSRFALARPAEGKSSPNIPGYTQADAQRIALNVLLYANSQKWRLTGK